MNFWPLNFSQNSCFFRLKLGISFTFFLSLLPSHSTSHHILCSALKASFVSLASSSQDWITASSPGPSWHFFTHTIPLSFAEKPCHVLLLFQMIIYCLSFIFTFKGWEIPKRHKKKNINLLSIPLQFHCLKGIRVKSLICIFSFPFCALLEVWSKK